MVAIFDNIQAESYLGIRCGVDQAVLDSKNYGRLPLGRVDLVLKFKEYFCINRHSVFVFMSTLKMDVRFQEVSVDAEGAHSFGIVALSIIGVIIVLLLATDALTFGMQSAILKVQRKFSL